MGIWNRKIEHAFYRGTKQAISKIAILNVTSVIYIIRAECFIELQLLSQSATLALTGRNFHKISEGSNKPVQVILSNCSCFFF